MEKFPFNQAGFEDLQKQLYALSDSELHVRAEVIRLNFVDFILNTFELDPAQVTFFTSLQAQTIYFLANTVSLAVYNRLDVNLVKPTGRPVMAAGDPPPVFKIIREENDMEVSEDEEGETMINGSVDVIIEYEERSSAG